MTARGATSGQTVGGYFAFVRRHWVAVGALAVVGAVVGVMAMFAQPVLYVAESRVAVTPQDVTLTAAGDVARRNLLSLDSDAALLTSTRVLDQAVSAVGVTGGAPALRERLRVSAVPNSRVLIVQVSDPDRAAAVETAAAVVQAFLADRAAGAERRVQSARADIEAQIASISEQLRALRTADSDSAAPLPDEVAADAALSEQLTALQSQLVSTASGASVPGVVVRPAAVRGEGDRPMAAATVCAGMLLGAGAGLVVARWSSARRPDRGPTGKPSATGWVSPAANRGLR